MHGSTFGSLSMSAISLNMRKHHGPLLNGFYHIPFPDKYRGMYEQPQANSVEEYLAPLKEMFAKYVPADEVACTVLLLKRYKAMVDFYPTSSRVF